MAPGSRGSGGLSRRAALALIGGGGLLSVSASGAFDRVDANRPFELEVDDENALLGVDLVSDPIQVSESDVTRDIVTLTNRFSDGTELSSVSVTADGSLLEIADLEAVTIDAGDSYTVEGTITADESTSETITLTIAVRTDSERIEITRSLTVTTDISSPGDCSGPRQVITSQVNGDIDDDTGTVEIAANVQVKGSVDAVGCVILRKNAQIQSDVDADGSVQLGENAQIKGSADGYNVELGKNSQIKGDVDVENDVSLGENAQIKGSADGNDFVLGKNSQIKDDVDAAGTVTLEENAQIQGSADGTDIVLEKNAEIKDSIDAAGNVSLGEQAQVGGDVDAIGNVSLGKNAHSKGAVTAGGNVTLGRNAIIDGDVDAGRNVTIGENAQIKGSITAGGSIIRA